MNSPVVRLFSSYAAGFKEGKHNANMHKPANKKQSLDYIENAERQQLILLITDYWKLFKIH